MSPRLHRTVYGIALTCWVLISIAQAQPAVYLHLDRSVYAPSDTIWFSAYTFSDTLSQTLYAELVNQKREVVGSRLFQLKQGRTAGYWPLPDTLNAGPYRLRAYTRRGAVSGTYASELLWLTARSNRLTEPPSADSGWALRAFPEGGHLVNGLPASVVVHVADPDEQAVLTEGQLVDDQQREIAHFRTDKLGLARVFFTPQPDRIYRIEAGKSITTLPAALTSGVSLLVDEAAQSDGLRVRLFRSRPMPDSLRWLSLVAMRGDSIWYASADSSGSASLTMRLRKERIPEGVVRFVVLNRQNQRIAERLAFGRLPALSRLTLQSTLSVDKLRLEIRLADSVGHPIRGRFSIAITDSLQTAFTETTPATAVLRQLLPGLPVRMRHSGLVWPNHPDSKQRLDRLLTILTHWPVQVPDSLAEEGVMIEGIAQNTNNRPLANRKLLLLDERTRNSTNLQTDDWGYFGFNYPLKNDSVAILVQQLNAKNRPEPTQIRWLPRLTPNWQEEGAMPPLAYRPGSILSTDTINWVRSGQALQTVVVSGRRQLVRELYVADASVNITDRYLQQAGSNTALHLLHYLKTQPTFIRLGMADMKRRLNEPIQSDPATAGTIDAYEQPIGVPVLIDDRLYTIDATNQIKSLSAYEIERVELVRALTKPVVTIGPPLDPTMTIIAIITRTGPYGSGLKSYPGQVARYQQPGYSRVPQFGSRNRGGQPTFYWNPDLSTDADGSAVLVFDKPQADAALRVRLEGLTQDGRAISAYCHLSLKQ
jgi:hypothetical protein